MRLDRIRELIRRNPDVPISTDLNDDALDAYINESNLEIQTDLLILETTDSSLTTTSGVDNVTIPATIMKVKSVFLAGIELAYLPDFNEWKALRLGISNGVPTSYTIFGRKIYFLPPPSATGTEIFIVGYQVPDTLVDDDDENPIPLRWFDRALVEHVKFQIFEDEQETEQADRSLAKYQSQVDKAKAFTDSRTKDMPTQVGFRRV